jgi:hypothetical protein
MSMYSDSVATSTGMRAFRLEGTASEARHSCPTVNSPSGVSLMMSQRSTSIIRPSSATMTFKNVSRLIEVGQIGSQPADNGFARFVKFQLPLERKTRSGLAFGLNIKVTD